METLWTMLSQTAKAGQMNSENTDPVQVGRVGRCHRDSIPRFTEKGDSQGNRAFNFDAIIKSSRPGVLESTMLVSRPASSLTTFRCRERVKGDSAALENVPVVTTRHRDSQENGASIRRDLRGFPQEFEHADSETMPLFSSHITERKDWL